MTLRLWETGTGRCVRYLSTQRQGVLRLSERGWSLGPLRADNILHLWEVN